MMRRKNNDVVFKSIITYNNIYFIIWKNCFFSHVLQRNQIDLISNVLFQFKALNKVQTVVDTVDKKVHNMNGAFDVIDIATDKLSTFSDKLINIIAGAIEKVFKVNDKKEIEEPKKETKKLAKKEE